MKRLIFALGLLSLGYVAGTTDPLHVAMAQGGQGRGNPNAGRGHAPDGRYTDEPRAVRNMFIVSAGDDTRAKLGQARHYTNEFQRSAKSHYEWAPEYRLTSITRAAAKPGAEPDHGERHINDTQIYLITGGSGTVLVEGTVAADDVYLVAPGEHRGGPITGGRKIKVKQGDMVSIPPNTWHVGYGDPGVPLQYTIIHIHTRQSIP